MFEINQDILCDYCESNSRNNSEHIDRATCEGRYCSDAREDYIDDKGIIETKDVPKEVSFKTVTLNACVYTLEAGRTPEIKVNKIESICLESDNIINIGLQERYFRVKDENTNQQDNVYLNEQDCKNALEKLCLDRILILSKIIGNNK